MVVGKLISDKDIGTARQRLGEYQLEDYKLNVIQGSQSDSLLLSQALNTVSTSSQADSR